MEAFFDILIDQTWNSMWKKKIKQEKKEEKKELLESFFPPCSIMEEDLAGMIFTALRMIVIEA